MFHAYNASQAGGPGDPRMRFYFYRQVTQNTTSSNELRCLTESTPDHYPSATPSAILDNPIAGRPPMGVAANHPTNSPTNPAWSRTFCVPTDRGYWGRDHVDPQGIPPDGQLRTAYGPYPVGGRFDNNSATGVTATVGMRGAGMQPMLMRSHVQFMLAEAKLTLNIANAVTAKDRYLNGINYSFADVRAWSVNGTLGTTSSVAAAPNEGTTIESFYSLNYVGNFTTPVRVATTANLTALSGNLTVDGVTLNDGDRVLVKNQTPATNNGIYVVAAGAWTRATDADASGELVGQAVLVNEGNANAGTRWKQTTTGTITLGTTNIVWALNVSYTVDVNNYVAAAEAAFDNRLAVSNEEALNYVAREFWVALVGNGYEAYNLYRRTGKPTGMQPVINPSPGNFPRSFWYPANYANLNNTVTQKPNLAVTVFWDTNSTNLNF
ncbi:MAG: SusD/RagB family nutrient-binding outer membrane lipoprotein [Cyclobacteriaceae bacterium]|nr:SusD/RagB family nutrient-binding outer membrane lipoprotein [Cyclobacteriaceae bacterium]